MKKDLRTPQPLVASYLSNYENPDPLLRKRSTAVLLLTTFGLAAMTMMSSGDEVQRNGYKTLEDCEHDYATGQCTRDASASSNGSGGQSGNYHYYGPWYRSDRRNGPIQGDPGPGRTFTSGVSSGFHGPSAMEFGVRGGFGSTGRIFARGS